MASHPKMQNTSEKPIACFSKGNKTIEIKQETFISKHKN